MKRKKLLKQFGIAFTILVVIFIGLFVSYKAFFDPYRGTIETRSSSLGLDATLTKEQATSDLEYLMDKLEERHPACIDGIPDQVLEAYKKELAALEDYSTTLQIWQACARILATLKDGHTNVSYYSENLNYLPLTFSLKENELLLTDAEVNDYIVKSINDVPWQELYQSYLTQYSYELESYAAYNFERKLPLQAFLEFIGVDTSSDIAITLIKQNDEITLTYSFEVPKEEITEVNSTSEAEKFVSYQIDREHSLGVLTLLSCDYNDIYCDTLKQFFSDVKEQGIKTIAVDLRNNSGGNSMVANEFMRYLDIDNYYVCGDIKIRYGSYMASFKRSLTSNKKYTDLIFDGKVYALTSTKTFCSAKMFANMISDNHIGKLIGEIPGNMPASYGDILLFQTPNTKLLFTVSFKFFGRIDQTLEDQPLIPDYEVEAATALDKLYELLP